MKALQALEGIEHGESRLRLIRRVPSEYGSDSEAEWPSQDARIVRPNTHYGLAWDRFVRHDLPLTLRSGH